eukprot:Rhum_TRINITY_DN15450_c0_g1::Rhum_TRINITY_DN15450_c0_g1_i17::g.157959::m.157959
MLLPVRVRISLGQQLEPRLSSTQTDSPPRVHALVDLLLVERQLRCLKLLRQHHHRVRCLVVFPSLVLILVQPDPAEHPSHSLRRPADRRLCLRVRAAEPVHRTDTLHLLRPRPRRHERRGDPRVLHARLVARLVPLRAPAPLQGNLRAHRTPERRVQHVQHLPVAALLPVLRPAQSSHALVQRVAERTVQPLFLSVPIPVRVSDAHEPAAVRRSPPRPPFPHAACLVAQVLQHPCPSLLGVERHGRRLGTRRPRPERSQRLALPLRHGGVVFDGGEPRRLRPDGAPHVGSHALAPPHRLRQRHLSQPQADGGAAAAKPRAARGHRLVAGQRAVDHQSVRRAVAGEAGGRQVPRLERSDRVVGQHGDLQRRLPGGCGDVDRRHRVGGRGVGGARSGKVNEVQIL